jgi:GNAT superfamily N-acetyltransferase
VTKSAAKSDLLKLAFNVSDRDDSPEAKHVHDKLRAHIESEVGPADRRAFMVSAKDAAAELVGGVRGFSHWKWLYISHMWVAENTRSSGLGAELIARTESEAKSRNCVGLYVDTFSEKARDFYIQRGFVEFGRLDEMPLNGVRYFLKKRLS